MKFNAIGFDKLFTDGIQHYRGGQWGSCSSAPAVSDGEPGTLSQERGTLMVAVGLNISLPIGLENCAAKF